MFRSLCFEVFITLSLCVSFVLAAKCYQPDGSPQLDDDYQPCGSISGVDSMCCATNRTIGISPLSPDICLSNGLCHNPCGLTGGCTNMPGRFWRDSCTDISWNSPSCLKGICANDDVSKKLLNICFLFQKN